jgi:hypothetical protein
MRKYVDIAIDIATCVCAWTCIYIYMCASCKCVCVPVHALIVSCLHQRHTQQCRDRWLLHLDPSIKKGPWSELEDQTLVDAHDKLGTKWTEMAAKIPGRT